jgi:uncharacterized BrkB/YihY/UPF0761 family membrane protein
MTNKIQNLKSQISNKPTTQIALLQLLILTHIAEEYYFGFPDWATQLFGTTTTAWYVLSHLLLAPMFIAIIVATYKGLIWGIFFAVALQALIFFNGLFHITTYLLWSEYSPGIISQLVIIPLTFIVYKFIFKHKLLTLKETAIGTLVGFFGCTFVVASLLLDIPI